jgi:hypothetical protein
MVKQQPMVIGNINTGAVKIPLVDKALLARGQPIGGTDQQKITRLATWFQSNTPKNQIADCMTCGAESDIRLPECPFCGDGDAAPEPAPPPVPATSGKVAGLGFGPPPPLPLPPGNLVKYEKGMKRPVPPKPPEPPREPADGPEPTPTPAIVVEAPLEVISPPQTEASLDSAVGRIKTLAIGVADRLWELGDAIRDLFDHALWTTRQTPDGRQKYRAWGDFCEAELGISHGYSLKLMDVAREFTREQVGRIGAAKLHLTLSVPKGPARDRLLGLAESGASRAQIAEATRAEIALLPEASHDTGRGAKGGASTHRPGAQGGRKPERITIASLLDRVEMFPTTPRGTKYRTKIPIPIACEERMFNGCVQRIVVTNDEDGYVMVVVERTRE